MIPSVVNGGLHLRFHIFWATKNLNVILKETDLAKLVSGGLFGGGRNTPGSGAAARFWQLSRA